MALNHNDNLGKTTRLMFDDAGHVTRIGTLCQTEDAKELPTTKDGWHFSGIHAINRAALADVPDGFQCIVRSGYMKWVPERTVSALLHDGFWVDTGTPIEYWRANMAALRESFHSRLTAVPKPMPCAKKEGLGYTRAPRLKAVSKTAS